MIKVYQYPACSTCKKALAFLRDNNIAFESKNIAEAPPTKDELREMIERQGSILPLFNTSGRSYRDGAFSDKVSTMTIEAAIDALSRDGMLIKRPFALNENHALLGFKPEAWESLKKSGA